MLARAIDVLDEVTDRVVVSIKDPPSTRRLSAEVPAGVTWLLDQPELGGVGPGAGMLTALERLDTDEVLFVPGDMPWLSPAALSELTRRSRSRKATSAAPIWPRGWTEPLVQWQRRGPWKEKLGPLPTRMGGAGVRPTDLLRGGRSTLLFPVALLSEDLRCFYNVNAPEQLKGRPVPGHGGTRRLPIVRPVGAYRAFWAASSAAAIGESEGATRSFANEAGLHARRGISHLEAHALEDALRYAREAGLDTLPLEHRLARVNRTLHRLTPSERSASD